jgi:hypothetical protein
MQIAYIRIRVEVKLYGVRTGARPETAAKRRKITAHGASRGS